MVSSTGGLVTLAQWVLGEFRVSISKQGRPGIAGAMGFKASEIAVAAFVDPAAACLPAMEFCRGT
jgi:hypothetical protein